MNSDLKHQWQVLGERRAGEIERAENGMAVMVAVMRSFNMCCSSIPHIYIYIPTLRPHLGLRRKKTLAKCTIIYTHLPLEGASLAMAPHGGARCLKAFGVPLLLDAAAALRNILPAALLPETECGLRLNVYKSVRKVSPLERYHSAVSTGRLPMAALAASKPWSCSVVGQQQRCSCYSCRQQHFCWQC